MWQALEVVAAALGLAGLWWMARQKRAGWFLAGLSALLYVALMLKQQLPGQACLNGLYVFLQAYGWWSWGQTADSGPLLVRRLLRAQWLAGMALVALAGLTGALDWVVMVGSVLAQIWMAQRYLDCWLWWVCLDGLGAYLYATSGLWVTALLYLVYLGLAVVGWFEWLPGAARQDQIERGSDQSAHGHA